MLCVFLLLSMHNVLGLHHHHVSIANNLDTNLDLTIHCKSKDNDLGVHLLHHDDSFSWEFNDNIFGTTLFYCSFQWNGELHWYDIYKSSRDRDACHVCNWGVTKLGPCQFLYDNSVHCFPWNNNLFVMNILW